MRGGRMMRRTFLLAGAGGLAARVVRAGAAAGAAPLKIGQIGTEHLHAGGKMSALRSLPEHWTVVGLVDPKGAVGRPARSGTYRGLRVMAEEELLATPGCRPSPSRPPSWIPAPPPTG